MLIAFGEHHSWAIAGEGLRLTAEMRMPFDLDVADEEGEPEEPDDADDDGDEPDERIDDEDDE